MDLNDHNNNSYNVANTVTNSDCQNCSISNFQNLLKSTNNNFLLMHVNIRSFYSNGDEFMAFISSLNVSPDIIVFTETWFSPGSYVELRSYNSYHTVRTSKTGGGVSIYVKDCYNSQKVVELSLLEESIESCVVRISMSNTVINIIGIYRPPTNISLPNFNNTLQELVSNLSPRQTTFITGDMNIDMLEPNAYGNEYINIMHSHAFLPTISHPTRVTQNSSKLIDHIWLNKTIPCESGVINSDFSDHFPIFILTKFEHSVSKHIDKSFRDHAQANLRSLYDDTSEWLHQFSHMDFTNINAEAEYFHHKLYETYNINCPIRRKTMSINKFKNPWINYQLLNKIQTKHELFRLYKLGEISFDEYNQYKNSVTRELRTTKKRYYNNLFQLSNGNIRETWKNIKTLTNKKQNRNLIDKIIYDNAEATTPANIANAFNDHFATVATKLDSSIPRTNTSPASFLDPPRMHSFYAPPTTATEVSSIISNFKTKGCHLQSIPVYIFKYLKNLVAPTIAYLFNRTLTEGIFPECLKLARIVPIYKSDNKQDVSNYRPISTLPVLAKIFEKLMHSRLTRYIDHNNLITKHQFGFQTGLNTNDAILEFLDNAYHSLDKKKFLLAIYLDFSKAFDTVNHNILLLKLDNFGIRGNCLNWIKSYLTNRRHYVSISNASSNINTINSGVPQGSILGPLLFLLYINDFHKASNILNFVHFADDTTVFHSHSNINVLTRTTNNELKTIDTWLRANRLSLNFTKTNFMLISNKHPQRPPKIKLRTRSIKETKVVKFLAVLIDKRLSFTDHVKHITSKISRNTGVLRRVSFLVPKPVLRKMYYGIIYPYLTYGINAWGKSSISNVNIIKRAQKRVVKMISDNHGNMSELKILKYENIYNYFASLKMYRILNCNTHLYFNNLLTNNLINHSYGTRMRENNQFNIPYFRTSSRHRSFWYQGIKAWNSIPNSIRSSDSYVKFKRKLKNHLITHNDT